MSAGGGYYSQQYGQQQYGQGLTLVHFSAQPELFLTLNTSLNA
jgi:hypothetical protein